MVKLSEKYDDLYNQIMAILNTNNLCQFDDNGMCARSRWRAANSDRVHNSNNCCGPLNGEDVDIKCEYLGKTGCTVKCLHCRIWFCDYVYENNLIPEEILKEIKVISNKVYRMGCFQVREPRDSALQLIRDNRKRLKLLKSKIGR